MKDKILIASSIVLLILSFVIAVNKTIVPIIKEENIKIERAKLAKELLEKIEEKEVKENSNEKVDIIETTVPKNDGQRVGMYIGKYVALINDKKYDEAYLKLSKSFRDENFPTLEAYTEYVTVKFNRLKSVEYLDFRLEGTIYVVKTKIKDVPIYSDLKEFNQVFMFKELSPGEFEISFGI